MPLPEAGAPAAENPLKSISLDDLTSELNQPRQNTRQSLEGENPVADSQYFPGEQPNINQPIAEQTAYEAGEQIATFINYISSGACGLISGNDSSKYVIQTAEKRDLSNAYAKVARRYGFAGVNPVFEAIMLTGIVLIPNFREAIRDRKIGELEHRVKALEQKEQQLKDAAKKQTATATGADA